MGKAIVTPYDSLPFVAWDSEGITYAEGTPQATVLLGSSHTEPLIGKELRTAEMFDYLLCSSEELGKVIHVAFSFNYDANQIVRDLPVAALTQLSESGKCSWLHYEIEHRPRKWFSVSDGERKIRIYDVFGYFQMGFAKVVASYLGDDDPDYALIVEGKSARGTFTFDQLPYVRKYWEAEQRCLIRVMDILRRDYHSVGVFPKSWHGPASAVSALYRSHGVEYHLGQMPDHIAAAAKLAYAGGRFETMRVGTHNASVYEYDINSAYPAAMCDMPSLAKGRWRLATEFEPDSFGVWSVHYYGRPFDAVHPYFVRDSHGRLSWPNQALGMYWTPEASLCPDAVEWGYVWDTDSDDHPFSFVADLYRLRQELKAQGLSAERAVKLLINSMYGKLAQQVGWTEENQRIPTYHQLVYAGWITSCTRAKLYRAMMQAPESIIACETDAVFCTVPLDLPVSKRLGEWSSDTFDNIMYLQSGFYFANINWNGDHVEKVRGFDRGSVNASDAMRTINANTNPHLNPVLVGQLTRYVTMGLALHTSLPWRAWITADHDLEIGGSGKRPHIPAICPECHAGRSLGRSLHETVVWCEREAEGEDWWVSHPHRLLWDRDPAEETTLMSLSDDWLLID